MELMSKSSVGDMRRIENKIVRIPESGCWLWVGSTNKKGYGSLRRGGRGNSRLFAAHRYVYELLVGKIPDGLQLDHLCKVVCCVNPRHLEPVTLVENVRRSSVGKMNRDKTHCHNGHPLSGENLYLDASGRRICRACKLAWQREWRRSRASTDVVLVR